jgi:hypothetical protein
VTDRKKKSKEVAVQMKAPPGESEMAAIAEAAKRVLARPKPPQVSLKAHKADGNVRVELGPEHNNHDGWSARIRDALGTRSADLPLCSRAKVSQQRLN